MRQIYRDILKKTAASLPRKLDREAKLAEFRHMFRVMADETDPDEINENKMVLYTILERIDAGIYPPFPKFNKV